MRINKKNPLHWLQLILFGITVLTTLFLRLFIAHKKKQIVILYGHKLNSNLKSIYDYSNSLKNSPIDVYYLTMDSVYFRELKEKNINVLLSRHVSNAKLLAQSNCVISDHGLHLLIFLLKLSKIKFIDVWHGIPFKGFDADDFKDQHQYTEVWVTSKLLKTLYTEKFGFKSERVHDIGYARTDILINNKTNIADIKTSIGIKDLNKKIILFAPTWKQDENKRNIFPFNQSEDSFLRAVDRLSEEISAICIFRTHLNTNGSKQKNYKNIIYAPHSVFPNTEEILLTADIMVCDWSSIAFDYLLLDRPTVFLDIAPPFKKGFSLDGSYRFGEIVKDFDSMLLVIKQYIIAPEIYWKEHGEKAQKIKKELYDNNADGFTSKRCLNRLNKLIP